MKLHKIIDQLELHILCDTPAKEHIEGNGGSTGDLLSDGMGALEEQQIWITIQTHRNVIAVATLKEAAAVILVKGSELEEEALHLAQEEGLCVCSTPLSAFEVSGKLFELLRQ